MKARKYFEYLYFENVSAIEEAETMISELSSKIIYIKPFNNIIYLFIYIQLLILIIIKYYLYLINI
jgi:hypothetical protein